MNGFYLVQRGDYYYLINTGPEISLVGTKGLENGVGLLDATCEYLYESNDFPDAYVRNLKSFDFTGKKVHGVEQKHGWYDVDIYNTTVYHDALDNNSDGYTEFYASSFGCFEQPKAYVSRKSTRPL